MATPTLLPQHRQNDIDGLDSCPVCHKRKDLNPGMILLVSMCFHRACSDCVNRIFGSGKEPCPSPGCGQMLRHRDWTIQTFEDLGVEKEVNVRKKMAYVFNKRPEDFQDLKEFNDYLEFVEEIIFNLVYDVDVPQTKQKIEEFKIANEKKIAENLEKERKEEERHKWLLEKERREKRLKREFWEKKRVEQLKRKQQEHEELVKALESTGSSAEKILEARRRYQDEILLMEMEEGPEFEEEVYPEDVVPEEKVDTAWPNLQPDTSPYLPVALQYSFLPGNILNILQFNTSVGEFKDDVVVKRFLKDKDSKRAGGDVRYAIVNAIESCFEGFE